MSDTLHSGGDRSDTIRRFERRRVEAEVRAQLFGREPTRPRIDRFEIRRKLGEGAMGIAYAAFDPKLQREVAIKLLDVGGDAQAHAALQEARALARLSHANVLTVHEAGLHEGIAFIVSELVSGGTLRAWLDADPTRRAPKRLVPVLSAIARGVAAAHHRGIAHRDLKPENVLLGHDGRPRIADFGLAISSPILPISSGGTMRASPGGSSPLPGTVAYMAPEQLRGERADPTSDQFSFCVLAFEALFRCVPFEGTTPPDLLRAIESGAVVPVSPAHPGRKLLVVLRRGLSADPSARWPSMDDLVRALERASAVSRRIVIALVSTMIVLLATAGGIAFWWFEGEERRLSERAIAFTQAGRYDACAELLEREASSDGLVNMWIGCAEAASDPARLERVCNRWNKLTHQPLPETCLPHVRRARVLRAAGRFRECAETILAERPSTAASGMLAACVQKVGDQGLYRRQCKYFVSMRPPRERNVDCDAGVQGIGK